MLKRALLRGARGARGLFRRALAARPHRVLCNVCGWRGARFFSDGWHDNVVCPRCDSGVRHRLLAAAFTEIPEASLARLARSKDVLHFAAEPALAALVRKGTRSYRTAELTDPRSDLQLDISRMPEIGDRSIDLLIACDVLEHVPDDSAAFGEIRRVLRPGGAAVLTVPQVEHIRDAIEDPSIVDPVERERVFGQVDHVRLYGRSFAQRLSAAGFVVRTIDAGSFPAHLVRERVLAPAAPSSRSLATNHRRVFVAVPTA